MPGAMISLRKRAKRGEAVEVKILISHPMESGQRRDEVGKAIPRQIVNSFVCTYDGEEVIRLDLFPAIAANPYLVFFLTAEASGDIVMTWKDDKGEVQTETVAITVV